MVCEPQNKHEESRPPGGRYPRRKRDLNPPGLHYGAKNGAKIGVKLGNFLGKFLGNFFALRVGKLPMACRFFVGLFRLGCFCSCFFRLLLRLFFGVGPLRGILRLLPFLS